MGVGALGRAQLVELVLGEVGDLHLGGPLHLAGDGAEPAADQLAEGRLAVAVGAQQRDPVVRREAEVEPRLLLVYFLRENLGLTGTNVGCDTSSCGACTVMMDGKSVKSCTVLAVQADGSEVTTIEGLATDGQLHPLQEAFRQHHGLQCGFCTPGMIMAGLGLIESGAGMGEEEVRLGLEGNLCRCTGYQNIVEAIQDAAGQMRQAAPAAAQGGSE